jgi:predicted RNase H-like HicB family nuclease
MAGIWLCPMVRFLIIIEKANNNYSSYCPDLPGCVATGRTREETTRNMHAAVEMHIQGLREDNIPAPISATIYLGAGQSPYPDPEGLGDPQRLDFFSGSFYGGKL